MSVTIEKFGDLPNGDDVHRISLAGGNLRASLLTYGATVQDLRLDGHSAPLVLGAPILEPYLGPMTYFGALVGRFANRIAGGTFGLDGETYQVPCNWKERHALHGGTCGTGQKNWEIDDAGPSYARLSLILPDGNMGFPGELNVAAEIRLTEDDTLSIDITCETTRPTPCSFAHHGYFILDDSGTIERHRLRIDAATYLPVDHDLIPTGEIRPVARTGFDFRDSAEIGQRGLDHNFCLASGRRVMTDVAWLESRSSGLTMTIRSTEPGLQVYDGAYMPPAGLAGLDGRLYRPHAGIALETQSWPDAPNRPGFPNAILRAGETYRHVVSYRFAKGAAHVQ